MARETQKKERAAIDASSKDQYEQYGLADHFDFTILDAWYAPWVMQNKEGKTYDPILALWVEYLRDDEDKPHIEPVGMGGSALKNFAPSETGLKGEYAGDLSREDWFEIANGNYRESIEELHALRGGYLVPLSTQTNLPLNTAGDFWFRTIKSSAEANGVEIRWRDKEGYLDDIANALRGLQGHASRLKNDLQKDMDFGDGGQQKKDRKILVVVEVSGYEEKGGKKTTGSKPAGGSRRGRDEEEEEETPRSSRRRDREREEEPEEDTRRGRADRGRRSAEEEEEEETPRGGRESSGGGRSSRGSGSGSGKKPASGPDFSAIVKDRDFRDAYLDEVIEKVGSAKGKKLNRAALVEISDFDNQEWNEMAFELATGDADWVIDWWEARREVDYDTEDGVVRLAK